jgi:hypothetical protein
LLSGTTDLPGAALRPYGEAQLRFAVAAWPMRAAEELRSALIFRALRRSARDCDMPRPWPARFASAMHDEARHARICVTVGDALRAPPPRYDARPARARLDALPDPLMRTAALPLVEVAMGETISMYLFRACRRATVEPLTRAALGMIVGDEVRHQRIGWSGFTALWPMLATQRAAMQREAARGLAGRTDTGMRRASPLPNMALLLRS